MADEPIELQKEVIDVRALQHGTNLRANGPRIKITVSRETDDKARTIHRVTVKHAGEERTWFYTKAELAAAFLDGAFALGAVIDGVLVSENNHETSCNDAHVKRWMARTRPGLVTKR